MKTFVLSGTPRVDLGRKATKALRTQGLIPCELYGAGQNVHFTVTESAVRKLIYTPEIFLVELDINGEKVNAVMKEIQFHPVSERVLHIDFLQVVDGKPVVMEVPVKLEGHAVGVRAGGKLSLEMRKLRVKAIATAIPEKLVINIDNLELGKTIQVKDLHFADLELLNGLQSVVCSVKLTRAAMGSAAAAAAEAPKA